MLNITDFICPRKQCEYYDESEEKEDPLYADFCCCPMVCRRYISLQPDLYTPVVEKKQDKDVKTVWTM